MAPRRSFFRPGRAATLLLCSAALGFWGAPGQPGSAPPFFGTVSADTLYGELAATLERMGIPEAHRLGLTGAGIRVGVLDGAFYLGHRTLQDTDVAFTRDFVDDDDDVTPGPDDPPSWASRGTAVLSLSGATDPALLAGPAFGASYVLARTDSPTGAPRSDEERWRQGLEWLKSHGVRVVVTGSSFRVFDDGFTYPIEALDGATTPTTVAAAEAAGLGILVISPTGDLGPGVETLGAPADGVDVLAVGAVTPTGELATFSAEGPTADGRPKPDVVAPGSAIPAAGSASESEIVEAEGTHVAAALVAGAAALVAEAHPERSPAQLIAALASSADGRPERGGMPAVIDVGSAVAFPDGLEALPVTEVDGSGRVTTLTPLFQWDAPTIFPPALPVSFTVLVAADSLFNDVVLAERVVGTFARRLSRALPPRSRLYWRVDAETSQEIRRRTQTMGPLLVGSWVELTVLDTPGGETIEERRPVLRWEPFEELLPPAGPFSYDVTVFSDRDEEPVAMALDLDSTSYRVEDPLPVNVPLRWSVVATDASGQADTATSAGPFVVVSSSNPPATVLFQNFPNPFPPEQGGARETKIWFDLAQAGPVDLAVYDLRGRLVRRLIPDAGCSEVVLEPGMYGREEGASEDPCVRLVWDARDDGGREVEPGVYLLRLRSGGAEGIRRVVYWP